MSEQIIANVIEETPDARLNSDESDYAAPVLRGDGGRFLPGTRPGPGTPSHGRRAAIACLDEMLGETQNIAKLKAAFQEAFTENPLRFFRAIVMPLLPKQALLGVVGEDGVRSMVKIIAGIDPEAI